MVHGLVQTGTLAKVTKGHFKQLKFSEMKNYEFPKLFQTVENSNLELQGDDYHMNNFPEGFRIAIIIFICIEICHDKRLPKTRLNFMLLEC